MKASVDEVRGSLPEKQRAEFDNALQVVATSEIDFGDLFASGEMPDTAAMANDMRAALQGKTGREVIATADRIVQAQKAKERERALQEIAELHKERSAAAAARGELAKFEVLRSRFYTERDYFGMKEPRITLRVRNGTGRAVSRAYFVGTVQSPGRSVPWLKEEFNYSVPGGLEPGEEATWQLAPYQFSEWGSVDAPADAGLVVAVTRLDGPDGEPLFSTLGFTEEDAARLVALQREYGQ